MIGYKTATVALRSTEPREEVHVVAEAEARTTSLRQRFH
jgi:hypothetical protein